MDLESIIQQQEHRATTRPGGPRRDDHTPGGPQGIPAYPSAGHPGRPDPTAGLLPHDRAGPPARPRRHPAAGPRRLPRAARRGAARDVPADGRRPPLRRPGHRADQAGPARRLPVLARAGGLPGRRRCSPSATPTGSSRPTASRWRWSPAASTRSRCSPCCAATGTAGTTRRRVHTAPQCTPLATQCVHAAGLAYGEAVPGAGHRRAGLHRRRRHQRGRLPRGGQLRRRVQGAGRLLRAEQQVRDQRAAVPADRRAVAWRTRASATACPASRSTATTRSPCSRCSPGPSRTPAPATGPYLVEAHTYRMEAHTNADDASRYRDAAEVEAWRDRDPVARLETYLRAPRRARRRGRRRDRRRRPRRTPRDLRDADERPARPSTR